jgi:hypothetical protein
MKGSTLSDWHGTRRAADCQPNDSVATLVTRTARPHGQRFLHARQNCVPRQGREHDRGDRDIRPANAATSTLILMASMVEHVVVRAVAGALALLCLTSAAVAHPNKGCGTRYHAAADAGPKSKCKGHVPNVFPDRRRGSRSANTHFVVGADRKRSCHQYGLHSDKVGKWPALTDWRSQLCDV